MQYNVIQIRYQPRLTHREDPDGIPETIVVTLQFRLTRSENRKIPEAEKLDNSPKYEDCQQYPPSCRLQETEGKQSNTIKAEHDKLSTFHPHSFNQQVFPEPVGCDAAQEP